MTMHFYPMPINPRAHKKVCSINSEALERLPMESVYSLLLTAAAELTSRCDLANLTLEPLQHQI